MENMTASEVKEKWVHLFQTDLLSAFYIPDMQDVIHVFQALKKFKVCLRKIRIEIGQHYYKMV